MTKQSEVYDKEYRRMMQRGFSVDLADTYATTFAQAIASGERKIEARLFAMQALDEALSAIAAFEISINRTY